jgi:hypothetical protein
MSSTACLDSAILSNTEKETLLRELADEFGYKLYSRTPTYILIDRRGEYPVTEAEWLAHKGAAVKAVSYGWGPLEHFSRGF